jgi:hypothetical protein
MSKACARTIGRRIRTCRFVDASGRCNGSNRPDQRNGPCPFTPWSKIPSTSNAISFPAIHSALSDAKRFRIGGRRARPEHEPSLPTLVRPKPSSCDNSWRPDGRSRTRSDAGSSAGMRKQRSFADGVAHGSKDPRRSIIRIRLGLASCCLEYPY